MNRDNARALKSTSKSEKSREALGQVLGWLRWSKSLFPGKPKHRTRGEVPEKYARWDTRARRAVHRSLGALSLTSLSYLRLFLFFPFLTSPLFPYLSLALFLSLSRFLSHSLSSSLSSHSHSPLSYPLTHFSLSLSPLSSLVFSFRFLSSISLLFTLYTSPVNNISTYSSPDSVWRNREAAWHLWRHIERGLNFRIPPQQEGNQTD